MLTYQHNVEKSIIYFVALHMIMEIPKLYFEAVDYKNIKEVCHMHLNVDIRGRDIDFWARDWFHIFARCTYKFHRALFVSVIYYFVPFGTLFLTFHFGIIAYLAPEEH